MSNVIPFPTKQSRLEDKLQELENLLIDVALDMSLEVYQKIDIVADNGIVELNYTEDTKKDMLLIHESIKSCLYRMFGKEHGLQDTANSLSLESVTELRFHSEYEDE